GHEAAVYQLLNSGRGDARFRRFRGYLPHLYLYHPEESILILELFRDAESLQEYHLRRGRFSTTLASEIGDALGTLHRMTELEQVQGKDYHVLTQQTPFILSIHRPDLRLFREISSANLQLVKIVQQFPA